ncbi:serine/arginine repetitive matrix protein 2, partial [Hyalella azteca]|uniref:Serine/arginine repetitive matrix protein 2 n=1 Tax=Hyalella azteca TaxID=294128 RepID=A0A979FTS0_HYAAZ
FLFDTNTTNKIRNRFRIAYSGDDGANGRASADEYENCDRGDAPPIEDSSEKSVSSKKEKRLKNVYGGKTCLDKSQLDTKPSLLNGAVKQEKSDCHKASVSVKISSYSRPGALSNKDGYRPSEGSAGRAAGSSNSLSDEKRETLRRLLTVSGSKDTTAVLGRKKIDSYKLSLTFPDDEEDEDDNRTDSVTSVPGLKPPSLPDPRSPLLTKLNQTLECNGEKSSQPQPQNASVVASMANGKLPAVHADSGVLQQAGLNKAPPMKIPPLHFRKLNRLEIGKNVMKAPALVEGKESLTSPDNKSPSARLTAAEAKPELLVNGRPRLTSPLLPTPVRKPSASLKSESKDKDVTKNRSRSPDERRSGGQRPPWSSSSRSRSRSHSRSRSKHRRSGSKSSRSRSRSFSRSRSPYRSRSPSRHSRSRSTSRHSRSRSPSRHSISRSPSRHSRSRSRSPKRSQTRHRSQTLSRSGSRSKHGSRSRTRSESRSKSRSRSKRSRTRSYSRSSSRSRSYSRSISRSRSSSRSRSRSRSVSIPRRRGSPSFLDKRRITSARKRPVPYHRPTPPPESDSSSSSSWSSRSRSHSPQRRGSCLRRSRSRSVSWSRRRSPSYGRTK